MAAQPPPPAYDQSTKYPSNPSGYPPQAAPYPPPSQPEQYPSQKGQQPTGYGGYEQQQGYAPPQQGYAPPQQGYAPQPQVYQVPDSSYQPVATTEAPRGAAHIDIRNAPAESQGSWDDGPFTHSFSDKAIRRAFIKKVYLILMCQLSVTVAAICFFKFHEPTKKWVQGDGRWAYWVSYAVFLVTYITLVCCPGVRRKWPVNFICLGLFTFAFSFMAAMISSFYDTEIVLISLAITAVVCIAVTIFAMQTKIDFTMCSGLMFALLMVLILFGFACMIVTLTMGRSHIMSAIYGGLGALVFSLFLIYDTQQLLGGRKHELSAEEHIFGALQLYLDIVYIFLFIMTLFGNSN